MKIAIGCDHGGIVLKPAVIKALTELGAEVVDLGTYDESSVDYPVYGLKVAEAVASGDCDAGVLMCGPGHNNANIIALGGRVVTPEQAESIVKAWFTAEYEGGRHQRRLDMIADIEGKYFK